MNELDLLLAKVTRNAFFAGFFLGAAFVGIAVLIGLAF
jgi:galactitol-specific phosphotransferase system IIC component